MLEDSWTVVSVDNQRCLLSARLLLNCIGRAGSSHDAGELRIPAPPALELAHLCLVCFRSAQFEHTVLITSRGAQILTKLPHEA